MDIFNNLSETKNKTIADLLLYIKIKKIFNVIIHFIFK